MNESGTTDGTASQNPAIAARTQRIFDVLQSRARSYGALLCHCLPSGEILNATAADAPAAVARLDARADPTAPRRDWKAVLGRALCWGAPLLIVAVLLAGGTGALTGAAGAALPFLAALACPLGMYFMMRSMSKTGGHDESKHSGRDR